MKTTRGCSWYLPTSPPDRCALSQQGSTLKLICLPSSTSPPAAPAIPSAPAALATLSVHAGPGPDPVTGAIVPPLYQTTTYRQAAVGEHLGYTYSRAANPTVDALGAALGQRLRTGLSFSQNLKGEFDFGFA